MIALIYINYLLCIVPLCRFRTYQISYVLLTYHFFQSHAYVHNHLFKKTLTTIEYISCISSQQLEIKPNHNCYAQGALSILETEKLGSDNGKHSQVLHNVSVTLKHLYNRDPIRPQCSWKIPIAQLCYWAHSFIVQLINPIYSDPDNKKNCCVGDIVRA